MSSDSIEVKLPSGGGSYGFEFSYPEDASPESDDLRSAFYNNFVNTPTFFNDGTADSVITDAGTVANTYAVASGGDAVVVGHLIKASGFTAAANNQVFRVTTASGSPANTFAGTALSLSAEAAPPATAKLKVVGFQGVAGDITATSTGLAATTLNFTTLGLSVGSFIKIGGTATIDKFATAANNAWVRITVIAAQALTLDHLPTGWAIDNGAAKTIKVWFGDHIVNGTTQITMTKEVGFMDQATPSYLKFVGMTCNTLDLNLTANQIIQGTIAWTGRAASTSTTSLDDSPDTATSNRVMAAHASVGNLSEAGAVLTDPNWARSLTFQINNNQRVLDDVASPSVVAVNAGECTVTGRLETYFGDNSRLAKLYAATVTNLSTRWQKDNQAVIFSFPRVSFRGGDPQVTGKNADVTLPLDFRAALDPTTGVQIFMTRIPYYED